MSAERAAHRRYGNLLFCCHVRGGVHSTQSAIVPFSKRAIVYTMLLSITST